MKAFKHLDFHARDRIEALWRKGYTKKDISDILGVHKSTVSREIEKRQKEDGTYIASVAEHKAGIKRSNSKYQGMKIEEHPGLRRYIINELKEYQSPECIAGRMREDDIDPRVSSDAIYKWLRSPLGQKYCKYLCTKRHSRKPRGKKTERHIIPHMQSIHNMPPDPGWITEGDTFLSPRKVSKVSAVVVVWRETKLLKGELVKSLRPIHTTKVMKRVNKENMIDAMILDRGGENREHEKFGMPTWFCDPASPRQKPLVEHSIGQLRRWWWPKGTNLSKVSPEEFQMKIEIMNNKYKKSLRYRSANERSIEYGILKDIS
jgi:IS30 family transposase